MSQCRGGGLGALCVRDGVKCEGVQIVKAAKNTVL
jgi:hypothetical protein